MTTPEPASSSYSSSGSAPAPAGEKKTLGITSLILGIAGLVGLFIPFLNYLTLIGAIVGIVLGVMSRRREPAARGIALAGLITSILAVVLGIVFIIVGFALLAAVMDGNTM